MDWLFSLSRTGTVNRRRTLVGLAVGVAVLVPGAIAWACNPQAYLALPNGSSYAPGEAVTVKGYLFPAEKEVTVIPPDGDRVDVRTNDRGTFTHRFDAPRQPDSYLIRAEAIGDDGRTYLKSVTFTVEERTSPQPPSSQPTQPGAGQPSQPGANQPTRRPERSPTRGAAPSPGKGRSKSRGIRPGDSVVRRSGRNVFAGSVSPSTRQRAAGPGAPATARARSGDSARAPSERAAIGDLWSGFGRAKGAALLPSATDPAMPEGGPGSQLGWGLGLLALGLVALVAGFTVAELRRRRALAP